MADPFIGEIRLFTWSWAPTGWALCNGALMQITQNQALNTLLGVLYGGDGKTTFALPDLRGRVPVHMGVAASGTTYKQAAVGGAETVAIDQTSIPGHTHEVNADPNPITSATPATRSPANNFLGNPGTAHPLYASASNAQLVALNAASVGSSGGGTAHPNMQPFLVLNFCIATTGIYPPRQ